MIYILFSILSSVGIYLLFKLIDRWGIKPLSVIIINYITAAILGFLLIDGPTSINHVITADWLPLSILIGVMYIVSFFLIAITISEIGIAITTVSNKMSFIIPITVSILIDPNDVVNFTKGMGIALALVSIYFSVYKKREKDIDIKKFYLPIILFFSLGIVDSVVKVAQQYYLEESDLPVFTSTLFAMSFLVGFLYLIFSKKSFAFFKSIKVWSVGILLGLFNYGSLYFLIRALNYVKSGVTADGSLVYSAINVGTIVLSVFIGFAFFKERLLKINKIGIVLAIISIAILFAS